MSEQLIKIQVMIAAKLKEQNPDLTAVECAEIAVSVTDALSNLTEKELMTIKEIVIAPVADPSDLVH